MTSRDVHKLAINIASSQENSMAIRLKGRLVSNRTATLEYLECFSAALERYMASVVLALCC